jgi:hypothetical protein
MRQYDEEILKEELKALKRLKDHLLALSKRPGTNNEYWRYANKINTIENNIHKITQELQKRSDI